MARSSEKALRYQTLARAMGWHNLSELWEQIKDENTPDWDPGKALEYLVIRAFDLAGLQVEYPYDVPPAGKPIEQIDGIVFLGQVPFLIECKDRDAVDVETIYKVRGQLLRRPPTTMGCLFITGEFTQPALKRADSLTPHQITLWTEIDIEGALAARDFKTALELKYNSLCKFGMTDYSPNYRTFEVSDE